MTNAMRAAILIPLLALSIKGLVQSSEFAPIVGFSLFSAVLSYFIIVMICDTIVGFFMHVLTKTMDAAAKQVLAARKEAKHVQS